jgi:hypothetical protein
MSHTVTLGAIYFTHQPHSSLGALIRRDLVIKFTCTLLKPTDDPKLGGCECGYDFSPVDVIIDEFR